MRVQAHARANRGGANWCVLQERADHSTTRLLAYTRVQAGTDCACLLAGPTHAHRTRASA
eukprot:973700-Pleurochrysis_carterae.AAC.2